MCDVGLGLCFSAFPCPHIKVVYIFGASRAAGLGKNIVTRASYVASEGRDHSVGRAVKYILPVVCVRTERDVCESAWTASCVGGDTWCGAPACWAETDVGVPQGVSFELEHPVGGCIVHSALTEGGLG